VRVKSSTGVPSGTFPKGSLVILSTVLGFEEQLNIDKKMKEINMFFTGIKSSKQNCNRQGM
jgi:hypothetical protein